MLNKEIRDILKLFIGTILVVLITLGLAFSMIRLLVDETFPFVDFAPLLLYITLMAISFYMGISLFAEENLIHEIVVTISPIIFGYGLSLFAEEISMQLELKKVERLGRNLVCLRYRVIGMME